MESDSPKPFVTWGLFRPANNKLEPKDVLLIGEEGNGNVSSESSHSCGNYKGKEILYSDDDEIVTFGDKSLSSEPRNVSLGLGFSEKGTRVFEQGECSNPQILKPKVADEIDLSLKLSLVFNDSCCSTSNKRSAESSIRKDRRSKFSRLELEKEEPMAELRFANQHYQWCIKKKLCESDLGKKSGLLLPSEVVESHIFPLWNADEHEQLHSSRNELPVFVLDCDRKTGHEMAFKQWNQGEAYVLVNSWARGFVKKRNLKLGDEIGLVWEHCHSRFIFFVLNRAATTVK